MKTIVEKSLLELNTESTDRFHRNNELIIAEYLLIRYKRILQFCRNFESLYLYLDNALNRSALDS